MSLAQQFIDYMTAAEMVDHPDFHERGYFGVARDYRPPTIEQRLEAANRTIARNQVLIDECDALRKSLKRYKGYTFGLSVALCGALIVALVALPAYLGVL